MEFSLNRFSVYIFDGFEINEIEELFAARVEYFEKLSIDDVRNIKQKAETANSKIVFVINKAGYDAQNALLKITEEPPDNVYFVFLNKELLLDTIVSRAQIIKKPPPGIVGDGADEILNMDKEELFSYIMQLKKDEIMPFIENLKNAFAQKGDFKKLQKLSEMISDFKQYNLNEQLFLSNVFDCVMEE